MTGDFGQYKILSEIGRGGMGIVYQAIRPDDNKLVAIKQLVLANIDPAKEGEFRDRFKREAATAKRLNHPNIVTVYDVDTTRNNFFYVMEYLEGHSLRRYLELKGGRLSARDFWPILAQVVAGLSFAHTMNVVHRDVKPDNIFILKDGTVKITDFGIARVADFEETHLTKTGVMMGTLAYVSPEQLQDAKNVDHRADIFSLGVVSYEALSGQLPFTGEGIAQTIVKIVSQEEKALHLIVPFINLETSGCVTKALRKRARDRYRSVPEFARDYEESLDAQKPDAQKVQAAEAGKYETMQIANLSNITNPESPSIFKSKEPNTGSPQKGIGRLSDMGTASPGLHAKQDLSYFDTPRSHEQSPQLSLDQAGSLPAKSLGLPEAIKPLQIFDKQGKNQSRLVEPTAICFSSGKLIVADAGTRLVHIFSPDGRWTGDLSNKTEAANSVTGGGRVSKPSAIAVDNKGRIYVADSSDPYVRVFDSRGVFLRELTNIQGKDGGVQGLAIDSADTLYLSDATNGCIQVLQAELGLWLRKIGTKGEGEAQFQLPAGLTTDRLNQLYCADYGTSRILVFNKAGTLVRSFGSKGSGPGQFNVPRSVAVGKNDKIYVLDSLNHRIQVFTPSGEPFTCFGGRGSQPGQFLGPSDISVDAANDLLYVADKGNKRIQVFELCLN
jgi:eukaryotic-like serine/threonine-protein kinase